jgi:peptidoglycan/LPS O-acetylase OafA/YrhL
MNSYRYIDSVHLLRGVAAMLVVLEHIVRREPYAFFNSIFWCADGLDGVGVSAFFVISGLVLPLSLGVDYH